MRKNNHSLPEMKMSCGGKRPTWPLKQKSRAKSGRKMWMAVAEEKAGFMCSVLPWPRVPRLDFILFYKDQDLHTMPDGPVTTKTVSNMDLDLQDLSANLWRQR